MKIIEAIYSNTMGGSETLALALANEFKARGHQCDMLTTFVGDGSFTPDLAKSEIDTYSADFHGTSIAKRLTVPAFLYRLFRREKYDVVHCHHMAVFFHCLRPARLAGIPKIVVTEHAHQHFSGNRKLTNRSIRMGPKADTITVIHKELQQFFRDKIGIPENKLALIRNGIDTERHSPGPADSNVRKAIEKFGMHTIIGCVSRLHRDKDVPNLIRAFHKLAVDQYPDVGLVIVGDGPERALVESLVESLGLSQRVLLAGVQTNVSQWLRAFDIFALPSRREGVPLAILEALSSGLPVVATSVGGVPEVIDDTVGLLAPRENPQLFADALTTLLDDRVTRNEMARNARGRAVQDYSFSNMVDQYLAVFQS